jgi:hypothetical protein
MQYARGARNTLENRDFEPATIALALERLQRAVPHLHFDSWQIKRGYPADVQPEPPDNLRGRAKWKDNYRTEVQVILDVSNNVRISSTCLRLSGTVGARTRAAIAASREGIEIKISSDGVVSLCMRAVNV